MINTIDKLIKHADYLLGLVSKESPYLDKKHDDLFREIAKSYREKLGQWEKQSKNISTIIYESFVTTVEVQGISFVISYDGYLWKATIANTSWEVSYTSLMAVVTEIFLKVEYPSKN
jgi:hypothetical protein